MKVVCHGCGAKYQVRREKVQGHRFRATCKKCGGIIVARSSEVALESGGPSAVSLDRDDLFQEDESWYAVITGKPHGPMSSSQLHQSYTSGMITKRTYIWRAGDPEWRRLSDVPEFADLFSEGQTSFYEPDHDPRQTGETKASGPSAFRRQGGLSHPGEPADGPTSFYQAQEEEEEATHYHVGREQGAAMREEPWQPLPGGAANPAFDGESQSADQVPVIPPRKAILPSPTGVPQSPLPSAVRTEESIPRQASIPEHTRPLTSSEKEVAAKPPTVDLPPVTVTGPPGSTGQEPTPGFPVLTPTLGVRSVFEDKLKPVGSPAGPGHLLTPETPPFWTTGKIAAAAAIGGGLAVALTVVVVVSFVRPKSPTVVVAAGKSPVTKKRNGAKPAPTRNEVKPEGVKPKIENVQITVQSGGDEGKVQPEAKKAEPEVKERKPGKRAARRVSRASRSSKRRRKRAPKRRKRPRRSSSPADVDQLLGASKKSDGADPDAILAAGKKSAKDDEPDTGGADPDAILAAGSKRKSAPKTKDPGLPRTLSKVQIRAVMRRSMPRVRGCYDKYRQAGLVQVRITIKPNGRADGTVVGKFAGTATGFCVLGGIHKAVFPKFSGPPITFTYPFKLQ
jgi:hypothetical protein